MTSRVVGLALALAVPAASFAQSTPPTSPVPSQDSARAAMERRGAEVMGVDQATSVHVFEALPNGGIIELQRAADDTAGARVIRAHLRAIAQAFQTGDFGSPTYIHSSSVPGARIMSDRRNVIRYDYRELPRGAALRISTSDGVARKAIWDFIAFQRNEHMATGGP